MLLCHACAACNHIDRSIDLSLAGSLFRKVKSRWWWAQAYVRADPTVRIRRGNPAGGVRLADARLTGPRPTCSAPSRIVLQRILTLIRSVQGPQLTNKGKFKFISTISVRSHREELALEISPVTSSDRYYWPALFANIKYAHRQIQRHLYIYTYCYILHR